MDKIKTVSKMKLIISSKRVDGTQYQKCAMDAKQHL